MRTASVHWDDDLRRLALRMLEGRFAEGETVRVDVEDERLVLKAATRATV